MYVYRVYEASVHKIELKIKFILSFVWMIFICDFAALNIMKCWYCGWHIANAVRHIPVFSTLNPHETDNSVLGHLTCRKQCPFVWINALVVLALEPK